MKTYVITGAKRGIGAAIASKLRLQGHRVISVDIAHADIHADLSTPEGRLAAITAIRALAPEGLDGLIPCAGVGPQQTPAARIARINYFGAVDLVIGLKDSLAMRRGTVLFISSNSAWLMPYDQTFVQALLDGDEDRAAALANSLDGQGVYGGGKQALLRWMRREVRDYARRGIRMNALAPGYTRTDLSAEVREDPRYREAMDDFIAGIPIGRPAEVGDQAAAAGFMLSEDAAYICGSVLYVDGGHDASIRHDQC